jgi:hypothetical protein
MPTPLTVAGLEKRLRARILSGLVRFRVAELEKHNGLCRMTGRQTEIVIDPLADKLDVTIHELIHKELSKPLTWWGEFEEPIVKDVLEDLVVRYINTSSRRLKWWRATIESKLEEGS